MTNGAAAGGTRRGPLIVVAAIILLTLPFVTRPFHIDDDIYLKGAAQILASPLHPLGGMQKLLGEVMPTYHFTQHPPLVSYYLALVGVLAGGWSEIRLHLAFLVFPLLAGLAGLGLARRFCRRPLASTLLLVTTPAFVVMAHGLMTDVPFLAFSLAATALFVRAVDRRSRSGMAWSGLCLAAACLTQYRGLLLLPLLLLYAWLQRRRLAAALLAWLPALGAVGLWCLWNLRDLGTLHVLDAGGWIGFEAGRLLRDVLAYTTLLGGATVCPLFALYLTRRSFSRPALWLLLVPASGLLAWRWAPDHVGLQRVLLLVFFATGVALLWSLLPSPTRLRRYADVLARRVDDAEAGDELFLLLMALVPLASQVALNLFASARSLLIALPFLVLLWVRALEAQWAAEPRRVTRALGAGVVLTAACALLVAVADDQYARAERDVVRALRQRPWAGARVWFSAEWGFRHYMEAEGYRYVTSDGAGVADGDVLVLPESPCPAALDPRLAARLRLVDTAESTRRFPIKTMSFADHAGFYSNFHGLLPYSFSGAPLERVRVFVVGSAR